MVESWFCKSENQFISTTVSSNDEAGAAVSGTKGGVNGFVVVVFILVAAVS
jgi:hypothetical protein